MSDLENKKSPVVITIARDFGAEGHEIGRILANELGIPLYDNEIPKLSIKYIANTRP